MRRRNEPALRAGRALLRCGLCAATLTVGSALRVVRADGPMFAGVGPDITAIGRAIREQRVLSAKPVGTTSAVFKLDLEGPIDAAFRPESRLNPRGHTAEIAAFRLARVLGLDNVAPVVPRSLPFEELARLVGATHAAAWAALVQDLVPRNGQLFGAAIYWIPELRELGLDTSQGLERLTRWLSQTQAPPAADVAPLAAQVSSMLAFDYLIGNFDRFSGANAQGDASAQHLFLRDHNLSFLEPFRVPQHQRVMARLKRAQRFSRSLVSAIKALPQDDLSGVLADPMDPPDLHVLSSAQVAGVLERRQALLSYVAALIESYGESNVLTFP